MRAMLAIPFLLSTAVPAFAAPPRAVPLTETVHGVTLSDEYRWMEDPANTAEMVAWVKAEAERTRLALAALPGREDFAKAIKDSSSALTRVRNVQMAGDVTAFWRAEEGDKTHKLVVAENGKERVLIDPNKAGGTSITAINNMSVSPDGKMVAVHQAKGGGEVGEITVYDVATGQPVGEPIGNVWGESGLNWWGDGWVSYTQMAPAGSRADPLTGMRTFLKKIDDAGPGRQIFGLGSNGPEIAEKEFPGAAGSPFSKWVHGGAYGARADHKFWIAPRQSVIDGKPQWIAVATLDDRVSWAEPADDDLYLQTTKTNSAGAILQRPITGTTIGPPVTIFEGNERLILTSMIAAKDGVYVFGQSDGVSRLFFRPGRSGNFAEIALPFEGGDVFDIGYRKDGSGIKFGYSGWLQNARYFTVENGKLSDTNFSSSTWEGAKEFVSERMEAKSADGTMVPLVVLRKKGALPAGGMPTIVEAYGGYGVSTSTPFYGRDFMAWIARGGALAYCGVRGGGERGRAWHEGGRGLNKPRGHEDFQACAATLKSKGIATAKGPVGIGTSMGGALVPPAVMKRPDLFAGMVPRVAIINATRIGAAFNGANQFDEMGDPAKPDQFPGLVSMDGYYMLASAKTLPPTLLTIGLNDKRVAPWMSAKFAARAQAKFGPDNVWLRADADAGHGIGSAEESRVAEWADIFAWSWAQTSTK